MKFINTSLPGSSATLWLSLAPEPSRYGRGVRLSFGYKNYARWWHGFFRRPADCARLLTFGPIEWRRYVGHCWHLSFGKFTLSVIHREV